MRVLVVDDEAPARARLQRLLTALPSELAVIVVGEAASGEAAIEHIATGTVDVVLLDIRMPHLDGFGLVAAMSDEMPLTIFCTAHDEHALAAFEARAVDYLLKPVRPERLAAALERARQLLASSVRHADGGCAPWRPSWRPTHDTWHACSCTTPCEPGCCRWSASIMCAPAQLLRHPRRHADGSGAPHAAVAGERLDPAQFLRLNKSDLVRVDAIREIQPWSHGDYRMVLHDGTTLSWSRRFRAAQERAQG
jgi:two-component system, LytTR family, response regulator